MRCAAPRWRRLHPFPHSQVQHQQEQCMLHQAVVWTHTVCSLPCIVSRKRCSVDTGHLVSSKHPSTVSASQVHRQHVLPMMSQAPRLLMHIPAHIAQHHVTAYSQHAHYFLQAQQACAPVARLAWLAVSACLGPCTSCWLCAVVLLGLCHAGPIHCPNTGSHPSHNNH